MDLGLKGKPARVTRSSSGIGKTTALTLLQEGERVVGHGLTWTECETASFDGLAVQKGEPLDGTNVWANSVLSEEVARTIVTVAANKAANGGSYHIEGGIVRKICSQKWRIEKW